MPHLSGLTRDFRDQIAGAVLNGGGDNAVSLYDAGGQRVRKVERRGANTRVRSYFGGGAYEVYRKSVSGTQTIERQTLHLMDGGRQVAIVDTLTQHPSVTPVPQTVQRYQLDNHVGTACVEVDEDAEIISYEEYHPYGTTAWHASEGDVEVSLKRYRYTGMEKDEETGFAYHGARYYQPWLGRWGSADPLGTSAGLNRYSHCTSTPIVHSDPSGMQDTAPPQKPASPWTPEEALLGLLSDGPYRDKVRSNLKGDEFGPPILIHWLDGTAPPATEQNNAWADYLKAENSFRETVATIVELMVTDLAATEGHHETPLLGLNAGIASAADTRKNARRPVRMPNAEGLSGYNFLNMPNLKHGGFTVYGLGDVTRSGDLIEVTLQLTSTWHDLVDVNEGYKTDRWKSAFARDAVPNASDDELTTTWTDAISATIDAAFAEFFLSKNGWPFESTPAPPMVTFDFDQALNPQTHPPNKTPTEAE